MKLQTPIPTRMYKCMSLIRETYRQVRNRKIEEEVVGDSSHSAVENYDPNDDDVSNDSNGEHYSEENNPSDFDKCKRV